MVDLQKILGRIWTWKLELPDQILDKLYEHRRADEYLTLTEAFDNVSFERLYENAAMLQQSRLIDFYTAPDAYEVFNEPDFIRAKIRAEGIRYWQDHYLFLRKHKTIALIVSTGLALIICFFLVRFATSEDQNISPENIPVQKSQSTSLRDSTTMSSSTLPPKRPAENQLKPKQAVKETGTPINKDAINAGHEKQMAKANENKTKEKQPGAVESKQNYRIEFDTLNHIVKVSPRSGKWDSTVLAIPLTEREFVQAEFLNQSEPLVGEDFTFDAMGLKFSGILSTASPAAEGVSYTLHYVNKPSVFLFGSYPNKLYPHYFPH